MGKGTAALVYRALVAGALFLSGTATGATYVVTQDEVKASDSNPGTAEAPWLTIGKAAEVAHAGDTVLLGDGVFREAVVIRNSGSAEAPLVFRAAEGAQVVITGADRMSGWERVTGKAPIYQVHWPLNFIGWNYTMTHPNDEYHRLVGRCEQVMVEGYLLRQVLTTNELAPGTFCADTKARVLFAWDFANRDLNKVLTEASRRQELVFVLGEHVQIKGIQFRYAANMAQHGAVELKGAHDVLEDCVMERMNSSGATFDGPNQIVRRCIFRDNGQIGFGANGAHQLLLTGCLVENNNTKGFDRGWEAGGDKLVLSRGAVLENSRFVRNRGNGIWFDIGNEDCTVRNCLVADNEDSGIFYEISFGLHAHDNVITGNGFAQTSGAWGAQAGIALSSSPNCVIERNLIVGNREGFNFREQGRTTPLIDRKGEVPIWNHDQLIQNNIIALNRDAQIWGWFDMHDRRHWPGAMKAPAETQLKKEAKESATGKMSLETLKLRFADNIYWARPGQRWFEWGVTWGEHKSFGTIEEFQATLGIDQGSHLLDPRFIDVSARDFRLAPDQVSQFSKAYPQRTVPGVVLGMTKTPGG